MVTNRQAGSGGDMLPAEFRLRKMGPIIGTRTWGGLVGISMFVPLVDGGSITAPDYRVYSTDGKWIIENEGVEPDITVDNSSRGGESSLYKRVLRQVDRLMRRPRRTRAEDDLLELLASLVAQYEQTRFPAPDVTPGQMIAHLMEARNATEAEVAAATAIPAQTIARFIDGSRAIDEASRAKLAKYFHVSPDLFLAAE